MKPNKIIPFVFYLIFFPAVLVFALVNCRDIDTTNPKKKDPGERIIAKKYISVADSIRNADPDSAILLYNKAIELIVQSDRDSAGNQVLSSAYTGLAFVNLLKRDFERVQSYDSIALFLANKASGKVAVAKALNIKALYFLYISKADSALTMFSEALSYASDANDFELQAKILSNRAQAYSFFGNAEKTIEGFSDALEMAKKLGKGQFVAQCYMNLGMALEQQGGRKEEVKKIYEEVLPLLHSTGDKDGEMLCLQSLGGIYCSLAAYDKAIDCFSQSAGLAEQLDNKQGISTGFYNLAEVYSRLNDNKTAIDYYLKAMKVSEEISDKKGLVNCYTGLGSLYYDILNYQEALQNFRKAFLLSKGIGYQRGIGQGYCNLASCFSPLGKKDSALICYQKAIDIYQQVGDYSGLADVYTNIGTEYENSKDYDEAEEYLNKALKTKKDLGEKEAIAQALFTIGEMFLTKTTVVEKNLGEGLFRKAEEAALESYEIARQINSLKVIYISSHLLEKIYLRTGNLQGLKQYSIICDATRDSLLNRDKVEVLAFAKARWDVGKKQEEIDHLKETGELQQEVIARKETESKQQKIIIGFSVILFALLIAAGVTAWVYFRKKREIEYQRQVANIGILRMQNIRNVLSPHFMFNQENSSRLASGCIEGSLKT